MLLCPPSDVKAVDGLLQRGDVAAVILEPVGGQAGTTPTILVLIFDEVIT